MRLTIALALMALAPAPLAAAEEKGNWQFIETADSIYAWGDMLVDGMVVTGHRFILSKTPQSSFMGDVSWMTHDYTLDCARQTFQQGSGQYLALDGAVMGPSAPRPPASIEPQTGEELIKIAVCDGRPIEGAVVEPTRESAMAAARAKVTAAP